MSIQPEVVARFQALFAGLDRAYGTYQNINIQAENGKLRGTPQTLFRMVTTDLYQQHLDGVTGLGIIPIRADNTCVFGSIDIDVYDDLDHTAIAVGMQEQGFPLIPCRSKSGGCHLFLFTKIPVAASLMQSRLKDIAARIGHGKAEIFPKQTRLDPDPKKAGSWINLPFFNGDAGTRYAVKRDGTAYSLAEFLDRADELKVGAEFFTPSSVSGGKAEKDKEPIPDGPPCLNHLIQLRFPTGTQDNGMFNLGIYARKAHPSNWQQWLQDTNQRHVSPSIGPDDMRRIIGSLGKTEYKYQCQNQTLAAHCNSQQCRRRKYGVGDGTEVVSFGEIRKLLTSPPIWYWDVEIGEISGVLELSTAEMQDPRAVQRKCMEQLNTAPSMPKAVDWTQTLQQAMKKVVTMDPLPEDASIEGQFWQLVEAFCTGRVQAQELDEVLMGKPHTADGRTYFRTMDLMQYLKRQSFQEFKVNQVSKVLRAAKPELAVKHEERNLKGKFTNLWSLRAFPMQTEGHEIPLEIRKHESPY